MLLWYACTEVIDVYNIIAGGITPVKVVASYRLLNSPVGVVTRQVRRNRWGIVLKAGGKTMYEQSGKTILSDRFHIMLLPKGSCYTWTCVEPGECIVIDFDAPENMDMICSIELRDPSPVLTAFAKIERYLCSDDLVGQLDAMQQLYGLLAFLMRSVNKQYLPKDKRNLILPAVDYITANYADSSINNEKLAELCSMSTVYFRKCFKAVYNCPPIHYLQNFRINKAKAILSGDYDSIGQVAESVGYSSVYHFSKMFKQYTGVSPRSYCKTR